MKTHTKVLRFRLKDRHAAALCRQAREVNLVWNFCNDLSIKVFQREHRFMSGYDFAEYTKGAGKEGMSLHSQTIQAIAEEYAKSRKQAKKVRLAWRKSGGARRSLGWIPFKASALSYRNGQIHVSGLKTPLSLWDSYGLADIIRMNPKLGSGSFSEDARGRWYLNLCVKVKQEPTVMPVEAIGIDLGLKEFAVGVSDCGTVIREESEKFYRALEGELGLAQRANKKQRVRAIHAKIKAQRQDALHVLSTELVKQYGAIFVGNVNASGLAKTKMAKSVLDAGWSSFRTMLQYKCAHAGSWFEEINESFSTQTCSCCWTRGSENNGSPKGRAGLGIREWTCTECGTHHDRDENAAKVILARGHARLAVGIPVLSA